MACNHGRLVATAQASVPNRLLSLADDAMVVAVGDVERRWGMVEGAPDYAGVAKQVMRTDIYEDAMKEIGYKHGGLDNKPEKLFDGAVFDPAKAEAYASSFPVHSLKA